MSCWNEIAEISEFKSFDSCSSKEDSNSSNSSSSLSSSDFMEDASSSSSSSSNGPLFHLSNLMDQLPIKKGLSKYYQGKSQSFASVASVDNLEDLPKRENPYKKRIKYCKSYCGGLLDVERLTTPKPTISKKSRPSFSSFGVRRHCSTNFMATCRLPPLPLHKDF